MSIDPQANAFSFSVELNGDGIGASFQEVDGLNVERKEEEIESGRENHAKFRLPGTPRYSKIVLRRGIGTTNSELIAWCQATISGSLEKTIQTKELRISLRDGSGQSCATWTLINAYPVGWRISDSNSSEDNRVIESIEFSYQYSVFNNPIES